MDPNTAVVIRTYSSEMHAQVALTVLESNGIEAAIRADDCGGSRPELQISSGVSVLVSPRNRRKADRILTHTTTRNSISSPNTKQVSHSL
jgi:hypothetical protein